MSGLQTRVGPGLHRPCRGFSSLITTRNRIIKNEFVLLPERGRSECTRLCRVRSRTTRYAPVYLSHSEVTAVRESFVKRFFFFSSSFPSLTLSLFFFYLLVVLDGLRARTTSFLPVTFLRIGMCIY